MYYTSRNALFKRVISATVVTVAVNILVGGHA